MDRFTFLFFNNKYKFKSNPSKFSNSLNCRIKCAKHNARRWLRQCKYMKRGTTSPIRDFKPLCSPAITVQPSIPENLVRFESTSFFSKKSMIVSKTVGHPLVVAVVTLGNDFGSPFPLQFLLVDIAQICYFHLSILSSNSVKS